MGAGTFPAGFAGAGANPVQAPSTSQNKATRPPALYFDPGARGFLTAPDGSLVAAHPVDQSVALAMFFDEGSIPSAPKTGNRFRKLLNRVDPARIDAIVQSEAQRVLGRFIARGDIVLQSVKAQMEQHGRFYVTVAYINLRLSTGGPAGKPSTTTLQGALGVSPTV
jgi:hypothetical protein